MARERLIIKYTMVRWKRITWIRESTRLPDVVERMVQLKWTWTGHIARREKKG